MVKTAESAKDQERHAGSRSAGLSGSGASTTEPGTAKSASHILAARANRIQAITTAGPVYLRDVEEALAYLAYLIETRPEGEAYWPLFDRLELERERLASRGERLRAARARL